MLLNLLDGSVGGYTRKLLWSSVDDFDLCVDGLSS